MFSLYSGDKPSVVPGYFPPALLLLIILKSVGFSFSFSNLDLCPLTGSTSECRPDFRSLLDTCITFEVELEAFPILVYDQSCFWAVLVALWLDVLGRCVHGFVSNWGCIYWINGCKISDIHSTKGWILTTSLEMDLSNYVVCHFQSRNIYHTVKHVHMEGGHVSPIWYSAHSW